MKKIIVTGKKTDNREWLEALSGTGAVKEIQTFEVFVSRGKMNEHKVDVDEADDMWNEIEFDDGSTWIGKVEDIPELFDPKTSRELVKDDGFYLPTHIQYTGETRGLFSNLKISIISFFKSEGTKATVKELAALIDRYRVPNEGLFQISSGLKKNAAVSYRGDKPYLLLLHGTMSNTMGAFGELNTHQSLNNLLSHYDGCILAYEHYTLSKSPIGNALHLVSKLPKKINLHILSHSRGGIIGDILCRFDPDMNSAGFSDDEINYLEASEYKEKDAGLLEDLKELKKVMREKEIRVTKFVRVASPASGTGLLSRRLDYFFNVANNLARAVGGVGLLASEIGGVVLQIIKQKNDPEVLPGLEAMRPDSPLNVVLNNPNAVVSGQLSVVAANSNIRGGILKGLRYVLTRLIFWEDNDFVVNSASMYNGLRHLEKTRHLFVDGIDITHTSYFKDKNVTKNIVAELTGDTDTSEFTLLDEDRKTRGAFGIPGGKTKSEPIRGDRDIVVVLPGIMGSVLAKNDNVIWLDYKELFALGVVPLGISKNNIESISAVKSSYQYLIDKLQDQGYEVDVFHYDWRISVEDSGKALLKRLRELFEKVKKSGHSIKVLAHSMGGLIMREVMKDPFYDEFKSQSGYKFVMLGTPWNGSLLILQFLAGQGETFSSIRKLTCLHSKKSVMEVFSQCPGVVQLLPINRDSQEFQFQQSSTWNEIKKQLRQADDKTLDYWVAPNREALQAIKSIKSNVQTTFDFDNVIYVAGQAQETVNNYYYDLKKKSGHPIYGHP